LRPLLNEDEVIAKLAFLGFVPVKPETFTPADQLRLFRGAEAIVAPHGAGLTNIGYCRPGTILLELFMDAYVNWCFRRLAALKTLRYDCVLGRSIDSLSADTNNPHRLRWQISPDHVAGAIGYLLENHARPQR
jgi:capsular polysaccharide biosynthesis protein